jgi:integrase
MATEFRPITKPVVTRVLAGTVPPGTFIRCTQLTGFGIRQYASKASFIVEARVGRYGQPKRVTLGTVGRLSLDDAKAQALKHLSDFARGVDPVASEKRSKAATITLQAALEDMLTARQYKASTAADYRRSLLPLSAWMKRLTGPQIAARYKTLPGHSAKARTFRVLRAVWHFAKDRAEAEGAEFPAFPGGALRDARKGWASAPRRRRTIADADMPQWKRSILGVREDVRDYMLILHYTGMRSIEVRNLTAADVNLRARTVTIRDTKTHLNIELPMVQQLAPIFERRLKAANNGPLFSFGNIRKQWGGTRTVCEWSPHDLRRGYVTMAHRLGVDDEISRALTGHAARDAHGGYVVPTADMLRADAQRIADAMDRLASGRSAVISIIERQAAA